MKFAQRVSQRRHGPLVLLIVTAMSTLLWCRADRATRKTNSRVSGCPPTLTQLYDQHDTPVSPLRLPDGAELSIQQSSQPSLRTHSTPLPRTSPAGMLSRYTLVRTTSTDLAAAVHPSPLRLTVQLHLRYLSQATDHTQGARDVW